MARMHTQVVWFVVLSDFAYLSAKDAKNAKEAKKMRPRVLKDGADFDASTARQFLLLSFASFASFADNAFCRW